MDCCIMVESANFLWRKAVILIFLYPSILPTIIAVSKITVLAMDDDA